MVFEDKTLISLSSIYKTRVYSKFKNSDMSITNRLRFCKTCCKTCFYICPRDLARYKARLKAHREEYNFVFISAKCIVDLYHWTQEHIFKRLRADDFLWSIVVSTFLFAIGMKLNLELNAWNLPKITGR